MLGSYEEGINGFVNAEIDEKYIQTYLKSRFWKQLRGYFNVIDGEWIKVPFVNRIDSNRDADGRPARSVTGSMLFSCVFLFMTIAQYGFIDADLDEEIENRFHKLIGWPRITDGPICFDSDPDFIIKRAGLYPNPDESLLYLQIMNKVFTYMRQKLDAFFVGMWYERYNNEEYDKFLYHIEKDRKSILRTVDYYTKKMYGEILKTVRKQLDAVSKELKV